MIYFPFKVVDKVYCCWAHDMKKSNLEFIESFDPEYFLFAAEVYRESLKGEDTQKAALAIRNIYHHSLETLFTIICASIQSPFCIYGWMNMATTGDVRKVLRLIGSYKKFYNYLALDYVDWESFANKIFLIDTINKGNEKFVELSEMFSRLWSSLCGQYLHDYSIKEYNSIKHGFRSAPGGYKFSIGPPNTLNDPSRHKEWISLGDSKYGSSFSVIKRIKGTSENDCNIQSSKYSVNWEPESLLHDIKLISISIHNILSFLKIAHDADPTKIMCLVPEEKDYFDEHWKSVAKTSYMSFSVELTSNDITVFTKEELEDKLRID